MVMMMFTATATLAVGIMMGPVDEHDFTAAI